MWSHHHDYQGCEDLFCIVLLCILFYPPLLNTSASVRSIEFLPFIVPIFAWNVPSLQFSSAQSLSHVQLLVTPWIAARQASLSITSSRSLLKLMSIESVIPSNHLILCRPLLLLPPIPPSIRVFSSESTLRMRWPKYWSFSFASVLPMNTQGWSPLGWTGCLGISNFLEEISSLSHSIVFLYFFALITEKGFLISPWYYLELCVQMGISLLFSFAFCFSSFLSYL